MIELQRWLYGNATAGLTGVAAGMEVPALLASLAFAVLFGAIHALMPGHGKLALVSYYLGRPSRMLGGLVPCPLTTFIMVYAVAHGIVGAGLLLTGAMALGMISTILVFVACTILLRDRALNFLVRSELWRERIGRMLESASALAVIAFGL